MTDMINRNYKSGVKLTSHSRSNVASMIYPDLPPRMARNQVARDIHSNRELRQAMLAAGYKSGRKGYTIEQIEILLQCLMSNA